ncbi:MAG: copper resistance protein CopC, partial [Chloroflexota bacterium]|nr:copper resistance protein CopC [Chloroflexota bacterium]
MRLRAGGLMAGIALSLLLGTGAALAHANLTRSEPAGNANLPAAPAKVQLWFSERPEPRLTEIQVYDSQRQR